MKTTKIKLFDKKNNKVITKTVTAWSSGVKGLVIVKNEKTTIHLNKYSLTHVKSGKFFFTRLLYNLKFSKFIAKKYFADIDFENSADELLDSKLLKNKTIGLFEKILQEYTIFYKQHHPAN